MSKTSYSAENITILEGLEAVRKRPAMYIGDSSTTGLHHMIWEIVDNSIDEALAGFASTVTVTLNKDGSVTVEDDGRGIPVDIHSKTGKSALETVMTTLHAGGKFDSETYKVSSGLHGVGASVVNALSESATAEIHRDGIVYIQEYKEGRKLYDVKENGTTTKTGTRITFKADMSIFDTDQFNIKTIHTRLRRQAYLTAGVSIKINDERDEDKRLEANKDIPRYYSFHFENGVKAYIRQINKNHKSVHKNIFYIKDQIDDVDVEVALQYTDDIQEKVLAFANNVHNPEGGTHISGFRTSLTKTLNEYIDANSSEKDKQIKLSGEDTSLVLPLLFQ
ncbi:hypothetical protein KC717_05940 [Candidatus Dojkabacteria bacterium]|uniref:DNA topoisomerase (ATP-hydrolyzing) n=1 Tax=Candidatus Dojkabacteria bacterium TaxID=2099670 RepID=A0A955L974_9BACT|nr:hypothetical protein [Candidatus Dojkabacteria bacterium]